MNWVHDCEICCGPRIDICKSCYQPKKPMGRISTIKLKRPGSYHPKETLKVCEDCADALWNVIKERKKLAPKAYGGEG